MAPNIRISDTEVTELSLSAKLADTHPHPAQLNKSLDGIGTTSRRPSLNDTIASHEAKGAVRDRRQTVASDHEIHAMLSRSRSNSNKSQATHFPEFDDRIVEHTVAVPGDAGKLNEQSSKGGPKFTWIHVPYNNPPWVRKIFDSLSVHLKRDCSELFTHENWITRHKRGRHSQHHACFLESACNITGLKSKSLKSDPTSPKLYQMDGNESLRSIHQSLLHGYLYLYFPFLHFDSYKMLLRRRDMISKRVQQGRTCPIPREVQEEMSFELKMIWEFLGHDPPLNCRRTLDQYRYPSLRDVISRDDDQILYKLTKQSVHRETERKDGSSSPQSKSGGITRTDNYLSEADSEEAEEQETDDETEGEPEIEPGAEESETLQDVLDGNVLMVDQLWLWTVDTSKHTVHVLLCCKASSYRDLTNICPLSQPLW